MARRADPERIFQARRATIRNTLTGSGLPLETAAAHTSKAALIRDAVRRSIGELEPTVDPFSDWIGGSDAAPAPVDEVVYDS